MEKPCCDFAEKIAPAYQGKLDEGDRPEPKHTKAEPTAPVVPLEK